MEEGAHIAAVYCLQTSISKVDEFGHNNLSIKDMIVEKDGSAALGGVFPEGETDRKVADQLNSIGNQNGDLLPSHHQHQLNQPRRGRGCHRSTSWNSSW